MRAIFISLVVVNLVVLAVFWLRDEPAGAPADEAVVPVQAAGQGEVLRLVSELPAEQLAPVPPRARLPESDAVEDDRRLCTFVGPFQALLRAEYFVEHLAALDVSARVQKLEVAGDPGFWVYQPPLASRRAALRRLHELQDRAVDSYLIPRGELENGISFGLFTQREGAEQRLQEIASLGYEVELREVARALEEIWVSMETTEAELVAPELWLELLNREPGLEKRQNFCPDVAPDEKFH